jgi:hypothetical protein
LYCEDLWMRSIFDFNLLSTDGIVRRCALLPSSVLQLERLLGFALPTDPAAVIFGFALTRYFDDCRLVVYIRAPLHSPSHLLIGRWLIDSYRLDCYIDPCELEDEAFGGTFAFLQGSYSFSSDGCRCMYMAKNTPSFCESGTLTFQSMQHYDSFCQDRVQMRLAVLVGKFCEIEAFSYPPSLISAGVLTTLPDLSALDYPPWLVRKALKRMHRRNGNREWLDVCELVVDTLCALSR